MSRMTQQNSTTNWVIQDSGGQPQMFKLVQSAGKPVSGIMTSSMAGQSVKIIKATGQEAAQAFSTTGSHPQVIRASKLVTKAVALPAGTALASRGAKMIKLTPEQMQNLRLVSSPQKIHINPTPIASTIVPPSPVNQKNFISPPILDHSGTRKRQEPFDAEFPPESYVEYLGAFNVYMLVTGSVVLFGVTYIWYGIIHIN